MSYSPGDRVELVRDVHTATAGRRGKVISTSFLGALDIELDDGTRLRDVDPLAVRSSWPPGAGGSAADGCFPLVLLLVGGLAAAVTAWLVGWAR